MKVEKCLHCNSEVITYKEDSYRWWYKCGNTKCNFIMTKAKPLQNKSIETSPNTQTKYK